MGRLCQGSWCGACARRGFRQPSREELHASLKLESQWYAYLDVDGQPHRPQLVYNYNIRKHARGLIDYAVVSLLRGSSHRDTLGPNVATTTVACIRRGTHNQFTDDASPEVSKTPSGSVVRKLFRRSLNSRGGKKGVTVESSHGRGAA